MHLLFKVISILTCFSHLSSPCIKPFFVYSACLHLLLLHVSLHSPCFECHILISVLLICLDILNVSLPKEPTQWTLPWPYRITQFPLQNFHSNLYHHFDFLCLLLILFSVAIWPILVACSMQQYSCSNSSSINLHWLENCLERSESYGTWLLPTNANHTLLNTCLRLY